MHSPAPINRFGLVALLVAAACLGAAVGILAGTWPNASFDQCNLVAGLTLFALGLIVVHQIHRSFHGAPARPGLPDRRTPDLSV